MSNDQQYVYQKERKEFGKQCLFSDKKFLMVSIPSNHDEFNDYILRNPVEEGTQLSKHFSSSEVRIWAGEKWTFLKLSCLLM